MESHMKRIPGKEKTREFRSGIWEKEPSYNENEDWIQKAAEEMQGNKQQYTEITLTKIKERTRKMAT